MWCSLQQWQDGATKGKTSSQDWPFRSSFTRRPNREKAEAEDNRWLRLTKWQCDTTTVSLSASILWLQVCPRKFNSGNPNIHSNGELLKSMLGGCCFLEIYQTVTLTEIIQNHPRCTDSAAWYGFACSPLVLWEATNSRSSRCSGFLSWRFSHFLYCTPRCILYL